MPDKSVSSLTDLVTKFKAEVSAVQETRSSNLFRQAGKTLQDVYSLHLSLKAALREAEINFKNLYTTYNYAASIVNEALKTRTRLSGEMAETLDECLEVMLRCCDIIIKKLKNI